LKNVLCVVSISRIPQYRHQNERFIHLAALERKLRYSWREGRSERRKKPKKKKNTNDAHRNAEKNNNRKEKILRPTDAFLSVFSGAL